jgi:hypothetical protein
MLKRKYIKSINPKEDFFSFWIDNCQGINTEKQLEIIYEESFDWASWLLSHMLNRVSRKSYALYSATAVLPVFETQYPLDTRINDAIQASSNETITQQILDDTFAAYMVAATDDFSAGYAHSAYCAYIVSYGSFARTINKDKSDFSHIANLSAISAVLADPTKKREIFDYGLNLLV